MVEMDKIWGNKKKGFVFVTLVTSSEGGGYQHLAGFMSRMTSFFLLVKSCCSGFSW